MNSTGRISAVAASADAAPIPSSGHIIRELVSTIASSARTGNIKAVAIVYDMQIVHPTSGRESDAVAIVLNHRDDYGATVFFPIA